MEGLALMTFPWAGDAGNGLLENDWSRDHRLCWQVWCILGLYAHVYNPKGSWIYKLKTQEVDSTGRYHAGPSPLAAGRQSHVCMRSPREARRKEAEDSDLQRKRRPWNILGSTDKTIRRCLSKGLESPVPKEMKVRSQTRNRQRAQTGLSPGILKLHIYMACEYNPGKVFLSWPLPLPPCWGLVSCGEVLVWEAERVCEQLGPSRLSSLHTGFVTQSLLCVPVDTWERYLSSFQGHSRILVENWDKGKACSGDIEEVSNPCVLHLTCTSSKRVLACCRGIGTLPRALTGR